MGAAVGEAVGIAAVGAQYPTSWSKSMLHRVALEITGKIGVGLCIDGELGRTHTTQW